MISWSKSIRGKMLLSILVVVLVVIAATTIITVQISTAAQRRLAEEAVTQSASHYADQFNAQMRANQAVGQVLATSMANYTSGSRDEVSNMLHQLLLAHPEGLGTYVGYEPGAFDGQDAKYVNAPGGDKTGKFIRIGTS